MNLREIIEKLPYYKFDPCDFDENVPRYVVIVYILMFGEKIGLWNVMGHEDIRVLQENLCEMKKEFLDEYNDAFSELSINLDYILRELFVQIFSGFEYLSAEDTEEDTENSIQVFLDCLDDPVLQKEAKSFLQNAYTLLNSDIWIFELDPLFGRYLTYPEEFELSDSDSVEINKVMDEFLHCENRAVSIFFDRWWMQRFIHTDKRSWYMVQLGTMECEYVESAAFDFKAYAKYLEICDILRICHRKKIA